jgi:hypothetical protein
MTATRKAYWEENGSHTKTQTFVNRNPRSDFSTPYTTTEFPVRPPFVALHTLGRRSNSRQIILQKTLVIFHSSVSAELQQMAVH